MAVGRCATLLALAVVAAAVGAQPPPAAAGNATIAVTTVGHDVTTEASHQTPAVTEASSSDLGEMAATLASVKVIFDMALGLLSFTVHVKGFWLAVVNTLVNIGRFLVELRAARARPPGAPPPLSYAHSTYF